MKNVEIADLHIHSRYSRATSRDGNPEMLAYQAARKGIRYVGTGDFTHPAWREELKEKLEPAEEGLYRLKKEYEIEDPAVSGRCEPRFVVSGEISSIYKKDGKTRKVHSLILLPGFREAEELSRRLEAIGNIHSDGRPILACPAGICWKLPWRAVRRPSLSRPISGRLIFLCSEPFRALTPWRNVLRI